MDYASSLRQAGLCVAVVGMNAAGKSNFGKRLAAKLTLPRVDTDTEFSKLHGPDRAFIAKHGQQAYKAKETDVVLACLQPGHIVVLGGGAIEDARVREALKKRCVVMWLQAGAERIKKHVKEVKRLRPEFETLSETTVDDLVRMRDPLYREVADIQLFENVPFVRKIPVAIALLSKHLRTKAL